MQFRTVRILASVLLALVASCDGDTGPDEARDFSGTYAGEFYVIATSTDPSAHDSLNGGAVTLTLAEQGDELYDLTSTNISGGSPGMVTINSTGVMAFPDFNGEPTLSLVGTFLAGFCDLSIAMVVPAGEVRDDRLTVVHHIADARCDWGAGTGSSDPRETRLRVTWTGPKS
jgi:hypothetical protein